MIFMTDTRRSLLVIAMLAALGATPAAAQETVEVTASWTPPTEGTPVHHYVLQLSTDGGFPTTDPTCSTLLRMKWIMIRRYPAGRIERPIQVGIESTSSPPASRSSWMKTQAAEARK